MRDSERWLQDDVLLFSDEFIEWVNDFCDSLQFINRTSDGDTRYKAKDIDERIWRVIDRDDFYLELDDDSFLLFKLTWL